MKKLFIFLFAMTLPAFAEDTPVPEQDDSARLEKSVTNLEKGVNRLIMNISGWGAIFAGGGVMVAVENSAAVGAFGGITVSGGLFLVASTCYSAWKDLAPRENPDFKDNPTPLLITGGFVVQNS